MILGEGGDSPGEKHVFMFCGGVWRCNEKT
jgi:hypothetical protein